VLLGPIFIFMLYPNSLRLLAQTGLFLSLQIIVTPSPACEFLSLKAVIDQVTNPKGELGQRFKAQVDDGWNSERVLFEMTPKELHPQLDDCRPQVEEYLSQIGFPPTH